MKQECTFWVVGGDLRQAHLAQLLARDGHTVCTYALEHGTHAAPDARVQATLEGIGRADCVIFPLPVCSAPGMLSTPLSQSEHALPPILESVSPTQILCGGRLDLDTHNAFAQHGLTVYDYFQREELAVANAVPTAEGALQIAMEELPITIHGARALVIGFGRVGKLTAQRFAALGAKVTVAARSYEQLSWAQAMGLGTEHTEHLSGLLCSYDLIINTVPAPMLGRDELVELKEDALVIDLASKPGGVNMDAATQLGRRVIWALSLPGKVAPITAGACIRDTVYNILRQAGI
ncbi:MAG: dipicolinate synthase subunit DpsA [Oscillospiraceae bacterium]|nr:dipicolinate synthase subunit DpsA [Oscillospiraceae bacterium]